MQYDNKSVGHKDAGTTPTILFMIHLFGQETESTTMMPPSILSFVTLVALGTSLNVIDAADPPTPTNPPKMHIVDASLYYSARDTELLAHIQGLGEDMKALRDVDFAIAIGDDNKANTMVSFITDNRYGAAKVEKGDAGFRVVTVLHIPLDSATIHAVSGLMVSLSQMFSADYYIGWGCPMVTAAPKRPTK